MKRHVITIWLLVVLLFDGCVDPFDAPVVEVPPRIVVDAMLTDQPGPHVVRLYLSSRLTADLDTPDLIPGATVSITDDTGDVESFTEVSRGEYHSRDNFAGVIGRRYKLSIRMEDGEQLESDFIEMKPAGEIRNVYYEYESNVLNPGNPQLPQDAVDVFVDARGAAGDISLLRWRWRGTYQTHTYPERRIRHDPDGNVILDPYPCSGYIVDEKGALKSIFPCECCDCWPTEFSELANVSNNQTTNNIFDRVHIGRFPVDEWRFLFKYHLVVEQLSLPDDVHQFWKLVQAQQQGSTNVFQPNVVKIKGNIRAVSETLDVFGVFSVSALVQWTIDIRKDDLPIPPYKPDVIIQDCRVYRENSTNVKPPFW